MATNFQYIPRETVTPVRQSESDALLALDREADFRRAESHLIQSGALATGRGWKAELERASLATAERDAADGA